MKNLLKSAIAIALLLTGASCSQGSTNLEDLTTTEDSLSYYFGQMLGSNIAAQVKTSPDSAAFSAKAFVKGAKIALTADTTVVGYVQGITYGGQLVNQSKQMEADLGTGIKTEIFLAELERSLSAEETLSPQVAQMHFMRLAQALQDKKKAADPETIANKEAGVEAIAKAMEADAAFVKAESGIVYKIIEEGKGENFIESDRINVIYVGKHIDGTVFDDSKGEARQFSPMQVVPGFKEALLLMKPGAKLQVYIPGELGYGLQGQGKIGALETLVFDIETPSLAK